MVHAVLVASDNMYKNAYRKDFPDIADQILSLEDSTLNKKVVSDKFLHESL